MLKKNMGIKSWKQAMLALGVSVCLIGGFLMFDGSVLGERTTGIATLMGILGIGMITHANKRTKR